MVAKKKAAPTEEQPVLYPDFDIRKLFIEDGNGLTAEKMKEMLGWEEEPEKGAFGKDYFLEDMNGNKVRLHRNKHNRPWTESWSLTLAQDILHKNWEGKNGEGFSVGRYGNVLSGQHRGIALIFAEQMRTGPNAGHWEDAWPEPIQIDAVVTYGVDESQRVTRTIDNVKPRSLSDVLFSDQAAFGKNSAVERGRLTKMTESAIRWLWHRTGMDQSESDGRRTHSAALAFLERHPHVIQSVQTIWAEDKEGKACGRILTPGMCAAILYLMGCSESDGPRYRLMETRAERLRTDWSRWKQATAFWSLLLNEFKTAEEAEAETRKPGQPLVRQGRMMYEVRKAFAATRDPETGTGMETKAEKTAIVINAWKAYLEGTLEKATWEDLMPQYSKNGEGLLNISHHPDLEGLDVGEEDPKEKTPKASPGAAAAESGGEDPPADPDAGEGGESAPSANGELTEAELEARKAVVRAESTAKILADRAAKKNGAAKPGGFKLPPAPALPAKPAPVPSAVISGGVPPKGGVMARLLAQEQARKASAVPVEAPPAEEPEPEPGPSIPEEAEEPGEEQPEE